MIRARELIRLVVCLYSWQDDHDHTIYHYNYHSISHRQRRDLNRDLEAHVFSFG